MSAIEDIHDFCIASCEVSSLVDIGHPLICETYICESKQPGAFTVWEGITKNRALFAQGIDGFDRGDNFVELEKRAREAAKLMEEMYMVGLVSINLHLFQMSPSHACIDTLLLQGPIHAEIDAAFAALQRAKHREVAAQSAIDGWAQTASAAPSQRSRRKNNRPDYAYLLGQTAALPMNGQSNATLENATEVVLEKGKIHQVAVKNMHDFQE